MRLEGTSLKNQRKNGEVESMSKTEITEFLYPYEYLRIQKIRNAKNGQMTVKIQDSLPLRREYRFFSGRKGWTTAV